MNDILERLVWIYNETNGDYYGIMEAHDTIERLRAELAGLKEQEPVEKYYIGKEEVEYASRFGPSCRDCADENGVCPATGIACGGQKAAVLFVVNAINYGIEKGFIKHPGVKEP